MKTGWLALALTVGLGLTPTPGWSQEVPPADPISPLPLYHDRPERGGFYAAGDFILWRQSNPLKGQTIAFRGIMDTDGQLQTARNFIQQGFNNITGLAPLPVIPGAFFGTGRPALDVEQVAGPTSYEPGFGLHLGWRFADGVVVSFNWNHLPTVRTSAVASVLPPNFAIGKNGEDQFLFSPVFNFPPDFAGPANKLIVVDPTNSGVNASASIIPILFPNGATSAFQVTGSAVGSGAVFVPQAAYGIWNGATIMTESFVQRQDQFDLIARIPIFQDDCSRWYGLVGPRVVNMWERFQWRTVSVITAAPSAASTLTLNSGASATFTSTVTAGTTTTTIGAAGPATATITVGAAPGAVAGDATPQDVAIYSNVVSNRLYGPTIGCGSEWWLGYGFSWSLDLRASLFVDVVKQYARYERGDEAIQNKRTIRDYTIVPELAAEANIWWYPMEGVQLRLGYDFQSFFNTVASPRPVDFNYGALVPAWEKGIVRFVDGFHAGLGFIF